MNGLTFQCLGCGAAYADMGEFLAHLSAVHAIGNPTAGYFLGAESRTIWLRAAAAERARASRARKRAAGPPPARRPRAAATPRARHAAPRPVAPTVAPLPPCVGCGGTGLSTVPGFGARFRSRSGRCAACNVAYWELQAAIEGVTTPGTLTATHDAEVTR